MKFSRVLGAAIASGALFSGEFVQAQINYRLPPTTSSNVAPAQVTQPSYYPATSQVTYPAANRYSIASVPSGMPSGFSGPSNAPMTRLPPSDTPAPGYAPGTNSVLTSPNPTFGPITPIMGPTNNDGILPIYSSGTSKYSGVGYGSGLGSGPEKVGVGVEKTGTNGNGCAVGSAAFQPFSGTDCNSGCCVRPNCWYGGVYGLALKRDSQSHYTFSYDTANEDMQYTDAKDADLNWGAGFAVVAGRYFNCGCNAVEAVYWGWFPDQSSVYTFNTNVVGGLSGIFNWDSLTYNGLNMGVGFVDNATVHALFHESEVHNIEFNVLSFSNGLGGGSSCFNYTLLAGWRYFGFRDHLTFRADPNDSDFTGEVDEVAYDISTTNNLIGFQLGGVASYMVGPRLSFNGGTKVGFFGNHVSHTSQIGGAAGTAVINNGPNTGREFFVDNSKNDVAFLTEIFIGAGYAITNRWSASAGYRAVAVTGLALPTDQIYPDLRGINDLETIESQSSMILHGAYFRAQFTF